MPDFPPKSVEDIWSYVTRVLTNLDNTRAAKIDNLDALISSRLAGSVFNITEFEQMYVSDESQVTLNTTGSDQSLGSKNITVALPSGASRVRAIAVALIAINNRTANAQNIDLNFKVAGTAIFSQDDVVSFTNAIGTAAMTIAQDCTTQVTGDGTFAFEAEAQISAAQNVTFTVIYLLFVQYKMS